MTQTKPAPKIDLAALATSATEAKQEITRSKGGSKFENNPLLGVVKQSNGKTWTLAPVDNAAVPEVKAYLRAAAGKLNKGLSIAEDVKGGKTTLRFKLTDKRKTSASKAECPVCHKPVTITADGKLRTHGPQDNRCKGSGEAPPAAPATSTAPDSTDHSTPAPVQTEATPTPSA